MSRSAPAPAAAVREMDIDGEVTLFHEPTHTALVLNETAGDVWRLVDGERTVDEIVRLLASSYGASDDDVRAGVEAALDELVAHHVVDRPPSG
ncbi:PqqD family protein [Jiangella anatolica]|uniref:PqqD family protein n=1 Tax=Jiangella anatolica TaxID=2670374 RepID=UPI001313E97E|nr:PqqD family protein [Jiangella anatolica]